MTKIKITKRHDGLFPNQDRPQTVIRLAHRHTTPLSSAAILLALCTFSGTVSFASGVETIQTHKRHTNSPIVAKTANELSTVPRKPHDRPLSLPNAPGLILLSLNDPLLNSHPDNHPLRALILATVLDGLTLGNGNELIAGSVAEAASPHTSSTHLLERAIISPINVEISLSNKENDTYATQDSDEVRLHFQVLPNDLALGEKAVEVILGYIPNSETFYGKTSYKDEFSDGPLDPANEVRKRQPGYTEMPIEHHLTFANAESIFRILGADDTAIEKRATNFMDGVFEGLHEQPDLQIDDLAKVNQHRIQSPRDQATPASNSIAAQARSSSTEYEYTLDWDSVVAKSKAADATRETSEDKLNGQYVFPVDNLVVHQPIDTDIADSEDVNTENRQMYDGPTLRDVVLNKLDHNGKNHVGWQIVLVGTQTNISKSHPNSVVIGNNIIGKIEETLANKGPDEPITMNDLGKLSISQLSKTKEVGEKWIYNKFIQIVQKTFGVALSPEDFFSPIVNESQFKKIAADNTPLVEENGLKRDHIVGLRKIGIKTPRDLALQIWVDYARNRLVYLTEKDEWKPVPGIVKYTAVQHYIQDYTDNIDNAHIIF